MYIIGITTKKKRTNPDTGITPGKPREAITVYMIDIVFIRCYNASIINISRGRTSLPK